MLELENLISHTLNNLDPTAVAGLNSLLHSIQARYAPSQVVTDLSAEDCETTEEAVQVAAAALGQLSHISDPAIPRLPFLEALNCDLFANVGKCSTQTLFKLTVSFHRHVVSRHRLVQHPSLTLTCATIFPVKRLCAPT